MGSRDGFGECMEHRSNVRYLGEKGSNLVHIRITWTARGLVSELILGALARSELWLVKSRIKEAAGQRQDGFTQHARFLPTHSLPRISRSYVNYPQRFRRGASSATTLAEEL